ncbi:ribosome biogenesis factor YjgA [Thalassotalea agariperforans]
MSKAPIEQDEEFISKSQIKKEMHELQALGRKIVAMSKAQRAKLPLDDDMKDALVLADKIKNKHEAAKRHMQYIGKLLREADLEAIHLAMDAIANKHQQETIKFQQLEQLRDQLIAGNNDDAEALLAESPNMERQKLRQLIRQAAKEVKAEKPGKSYRDLFQYIKENK